MAFHSEQHVVETAQDVRADRVSLERGGKRGSLRVVCRDAEMVRPEMDETLDERGVGLQRALGAGLHGVAVEIADLTDEILPHHPHHRIGGFG